MEYYVWKIIAKCICNTNVGVWILFLFLASVAAHAGLYLIGNLSSEGSFSGIHYVVEATNVYVWPLGYGALNNEIKTSEQGGTIGDLTLAAGPEGVLNYQAIAFKGTETSYIDLRIPSTTPLNNDCAILFYTYLESNTDGVLFHFESDDVGAEDSFTGIEVTFDSTNIMFEFTGNSHSFAGGSDSIPNTIPTGQWVAIGFDWDYSSGRIKFYVNDVFTDVEDGPKNIGIGLPGTIRLGHTLPSSSSPAALSGRVTCFIIKAGDYSYGSIGTDVQDCLSSNWVLPTAPCETDCKAYKGYFLLSDTGTVPSSLVTRLDSATLAQYTSRRCADMCLADSQCVSFVTHQSAKYCETFSGDYSLFMETSAYSDSKYYVRRDKCCM